MTIVAVLHIVPLVLFRNILHLKTPLCNLNCLYLPEEIVAGNHQKINYIYSASGEKLACDANGSLTYYRSVMVYGSENKLLYMLTPKARYPAAKVPPERPTPTTTSRPITSEVRV